MDIKIRITTITGFLVLLFFINGASYFFAPEIVHTSSILKFIKYLVFLIFLLITFKENFKGKIIFSLFIVPLAIYYFFINSMSDFVNYVNYVLPFFVFLSINSLRRLNWKRIVFSTIMLSYIFGFVEVFLLDNHFFMYNRGLNAYRAVSIFLNPNNFGIVLAILTYCYVTFLSDRKLVNIAMLFGSFLFIKFSGSKTALIVYIFYLLYIALKYLVENRSFVYQTIKKLGLTAFSVITGVIAITTVLIALKIQSQISIRRFDLETLMIRLSAYIDFFVNSEGNVVFPWFSSQTYIDNIYLHLYGSFGILGLASFVLLNLYLLLMLKKKADHCVLLLSFLLLGITTNFLYVWPLSYMYWGFVGYHIHLKREKKLFRGQLSES